MTNLETLEWVRDALLRSTAGRTDEDEGEQPVTSVEVQASKRYKTSDGKPAPLPRPLPRPPLRPSGAGAAKCRNSA